MSGARLPRAVLWTPHHARATRGRLGTWRAGSRATAACPEGANRGI